MTPEDFQLERDADVAWVLSKPQGRRFLHRLAFDRELGGLMRDPEVPGDDAGTKKNCGRQSLARSLLALAEATDPGLFEKMMREAHEPGHRVTRSLVPRDGDSSP